MSSLQLALEKVRSLFRRTKQPDDTPDVAPAMPLRATMIIAPGGDDLTATMARWVHSLALELGTVDAMLVGEMASSEQVRAVLKNHENDGILVVFYGHGCDAAFLTTPERGYDAEKHGGIFARLCTASDFPPNTNALVIAFCCAAASGMAAELCSMSKTAAFLGFRRDIPFILSSQERQDAFRRPMHAAVCDVYRSGFLDELAVQNLKQAYRVEQRKWLPGGEFGRDTRSILMSMCLDEHRKAVHWVS